VLFTHGFVPATFPGWIAVVAWAGSVAEGAMIVEMLSLAAWVSLGVDSCEGV
jgi:hypothetical protein